MRIRSLRPPHLYIYSSPSSLYSGNTSFKLNHYILLTLLSQCCLLLSQVVYYDYMCFIEQFVLFFLQLTASFLKVYANTLVIIDKDSLLHQILFKLLWFRFSTHVYCTLDFCNSILFIKICPNTLPSVYLYLWQLPRKLKTRTSLPLHTLF